MFVHIGEDCRDIHIRAGQGYPLFYTVLLYLQHVAQVPQGDMEQSFHLVITSYIVQRDAQQLQQHIIASLAVDLVGYPILDVPQSLKCFFRIPSR